MDETELKRILAPYCPPLGLSQLEDIASEIVDLSMKELKATEVSRRKSRSRK
jgi:hypothetical protein